MRHLRPALVMAALTLAGCGGNSTPDSAPRSTEPQPPSNGATTATTRASGPVDGAGATTPDGSSIVPAVDVIEVSTGRSVALRAAIATDKPTLIWMWAPH